MATPVMLQLPPAVPAADPVVFTDYSQWERRPSRTFTSTKSKPLPADTTCAHGAGRKRVSAIAAHVTVQARPSSKPPPPTHVARRPSRVKVLEPASLRLLRVGVARCMH